MLNLKSCSYKILCVLPYMRAYDPVWHESSCCNENKSIKKYFLNRILTQFFTRAESGHATAFGPPSHAPARGQRGRRPAGKPVKPV